MTLVRKNPLGCYKFDQAEVMRRRKKIIALTKGKEPFLEREMDFAPSPYGPL